MHLVVLAKLSHSYYDNTLLLKSDVEPKGADIAGCCTHSAFLVIPSSMLHPGNGGSLRTNVA